MFKRLREKRAQAARRAALWSEIDLQNRRIEVVLSLGMDQRPIGARAITRYEALRDSARAELLALELEGL